MDTLQVAGHGVPAGVVARSWLTDPAVGQLRQLTVRELIADLARLEDAHRSTTPSGPASLRAQDLDRARAQEHRIVAELRRRRSLRSSQQR